MDALGEIESNVDKENGGDGADDKRTEASGARAELTLEQRLALAVEAAKEVKALVSADQGVTRKSQDVHIPQRHLVEADDYRLKFSDGKTVGHRALRVYYRQRFDPHLNRDMQLARKMRKHYLALGFRGTVATPAERKATALAKKAERRAQAKRMRTETKSHKLFVVREQIMM